MEHQKEEKKALGAPICFLCQTFRLGMTRGTVQFWGVYLRMHRHPQRGLPGYDWLDPTVQSLGTTSVS